MPSHNRVVLIGRLTRDPEMRYTSTNVALASFSIAVDRRSKNAQGERQTDFFRCTAWRQTAEFMSNYVHKGRLVCVDGRIEINEYTDKEGQRRTSVDVQCDSVETLEAPRDGSAPPPGGGTEPGYYADSEVGAGRPSAPAAGRSGPTAGSAAQAATAPSGAARPATSPVVPTDEDFDDADPFGDS